MSQGHVIDIMTYNSYSLQYYSFGKEKTMRLDLTNHTSTKAGPKKMTRGQVFVTPRESLTKIRVVRVIRGCLVASQEIFGGNLF